jgi:hypothetical protein
MFALNLRCKMSVGQVVGFEQRINAEPLTFADRLWVKTHLKPEEEKLWVSS